jgi:hypothetical protein
MAKAVSRRPLTAEARVRAPVSPCDICGTQSGSVTGFSTISTAFPASTIPPAGGRSSEISSHTMDMNKIINIHIDM